ncbi:MAG: methyltransferase domain-containing protein [Chloroflexota bacterium]
MSKKEQSIRVDVFDNNPEGYHGFQSFFLSQLEEVSQLYRRFFESLDLNNGHKIIEVGIGTGLNIEYYPSGAELHGIDISANMLELARKKLATLNREAEIKVGDAYDIQYPDNYFDRVAGIFVVGVADYPQKMLSEMSRICKPGGQIGIIDYHKSQQLNTVIDQQFFGETMSQGIFFAGKPVLACNALHDLDEYVRDMDLDLVFDERIDKSFSQSFRATIFRKK